LAGLEMAAAKPKSDVTNPKCPICGSDSWRNGTSRTHRRRYKCKFCGRRFDERAGTPFHWMHKPVQDILTATVLYMKYPLSSYQVKEILGMFGVKASARQIERWPKRFGPSVEQVFKRFKIKLSRVRRAEEEFVPYKWVPSEPSERGKRKLAYKMTVLDPEDNVVASYLSSERPRGFEAG